MLPSVYYKQMFPEEVVNTLKDIKNSRPSQANWVNVFLDNLKYGKELAENSDKTFFMKRIMDSQSFHGGQSLNSIVNSSLDFLAGGKEWENILITLRDELAGGILGGFEYTHDGAEWGPYTVDHGFVRSIMPSHAGFVCDQWQIMRLRGRYSEAFVGWLPREPEGSEIDCMRILGWNTTRPANSPRLALDFIELVKTLFDRADVIEGKVAVQYDEDFVIGGSSSRYETTDSLTICGKRKLTKLGKFYSRIGGCVIAEGNTDTRAFFYRDQKRAIDTHGPDALKYLNNKINIYS